MFRLYFVVAIKIRAYRIALLIDLIPVKRYLNLKHNNYNQDVLCENVSFVRCARHRLRPAYVCQQSNHVYAVCLHKHRIL